MEDNIEKPDFASLTVDYFNCMSGDVVSGYAISKGLAKLWEDKVAPLQSRILELQKEKEAETESANKWLKKYNEMSDIAFKNANRHAAEISELKEEIERLRKAFEPYEKMAIKLTTG